MDTRSNESIAKGGYLRQSVWEQLTSKFQGDGSERCVPSDEIEQL